MTNDGPADTKGEVSRRESLETAGLGWLHYNGWAERWSGGRRQVSPRNRGYARHVYTLRGDSLAPSAAGPPFPGRYDAISRGAISGSLRISNAIRQRAQRTRKNIAYVHTTTTPLHLDIQVVYCTDQIPTTAELQRTCAQKRVDCQHDPEIRKQKQQSAQVCGRLLSDTFTPLYRTPVPNDTLFSQLYLTAYHRRRSVLPRLREDNDLFNNDCHRSSLACPLDCSMSAVQDESSSGHAICQTCGNGAEVRAGSPTDLAQSRVFSTTVIPQSSLRLLQVQTTGYTYRLGYARYGWREVV
ncbi:hypothetical protein Bbelb_228520 [Branchiostoma belcheri]|nr:hypothetical protein Bbelb_228520 [Branchiostoma belcheri]